MPHLRIRAVLALLTTPLAAQQPPDLAADIDSYLDQRGLAPAAAATATRELVGKLQAAGLDAAAVEGLLRAPRHGWRKRDPVEPGKLGTRLFALQCEHVDYKTAYFLFVPKSYRADRPGKLLVVAHGGNSAMVIRRAAGAAFVGTRVWVRVAEQHGFLLAAPVTQRGWGQIGNAVVFSLISKLQREWHIDPDRIYVTGHSMGGHMTWRSALSLGDRWGAVAPMSGGYDFVKNDAIRNLFNVAGYATYCQQEPYGIDKDNRTNAAWLTKHGYDWVSVQRPGRHTIPTDDLPEIAKFFDARPRDMYPKRVYARRGGRMRVDQAPDLETSKARNWPRTEGWKGPHTWDPHRPLDFSTTHWLRLVPRDPATTTVDGKPQTIVQTVLAENRGDNTIVVTADQAREVRLYLHPRMVDFGKPVKVLVNGTTAFDGKVKPDLATMLELVREFDDRGRIYHAELRLPVTTDRPVEPPRRTPASGKEPRPGR